jgi:hypothetical protein
VTESPACSRLYWEPEMAVYFFDFREEAELVVDEHTRGVVSPKLASLLAAVRSSQFELEVEINSPRTLGTESAADGVFASGRPDQRSSRVTISQ